MAFNSTGYASETADGLLHRIRPVSYPGWLKEVDVGPLVRFPDLSPNRPERDLAEALRSHVLIEAARIAAGDHKRLCREAGRVWDVSYESASRIIRTYRAGTVALSSAKLTALTVRFPELRELSAWPWNALYFRRLNDLPVFSPTLRRLHQDETSDAVGVDRFWFELCALRREFQGGRVSGLSARTQSMLDCLPHAIRHRSIRPVAIEFVDLVHRLLHALPIPLLAEEIGTDILLEPVLTHAELFAIRRTAPMAGGRDRWSETTFALRYAIATSWGDPHILSVCRKAWEFIPRVRKDHDVLDALDHDLNQCA